MQDLARLHQWSSQHPGWFDLFALIGFAIALTFTVVFPLVVFARKQFHIYRPENAALFELRKKAVHMERAFKALDRLRDKVNDARLLNDDIREFIEAWMYLQIFTLFGSVGVVLIGVLAILNLAEKIGHLPPRAPWLNHASVPLLLLLVFASYVMSGLQMVKIQRAQALRKTVENARKRMEAIVQAQGLAEEEAALFVQMVFDKDHEEAKKRAEMKAGTKK